MEKILLGTELIILTKLELKVKIESRSRRKRYCRILLNYVDNNKKLKLRIKDLENGILEHSNYVDSNNFPSYLWLTNVSGNEYESEKVEYGNGTKWYD